MPPEDLDLRALQLHGDIDAEHISAQFADGILELRIARPKKEETKTVQISVG